MFPTSSKELIDWDCILCIHQGWGPIAPFPPFFHVSCIHWIQFVSSCVCMWVILSSLLMFLSGMIEHGQFWRLKRSMFHWCAEFVPRAKMNPPITSITSNTKVPNVLAIIMFLPTEAMSRKIAEANWLTSTSSIYCLNILLRIFCCYLLISEKKK